MVATHEFRLRLPLPEHIPPHFVVGHLQAYESLITPHPYLVRFQRRPVVVHELVDDPFFREDGRKLQAFVVVERIALIPGAGSWAAKNIQIPAVFQSFENGVRCRADAQGGVRVWSSYEVCPRGNIGAMSGSSESVLDGGSRLSAASIEGYDLVETVRLECGSLLKPFVVKSIEPAHRAICQKMIDEMTRVHDKGYWLPEDS